MKIVAKLLTAAIISAGTLAAHADPMTFAGTTTGSFTGAAGTSTATVSTLTFNGGTFNDTTANNGFVAIGNNGTSDNFGAFTLSASTASYNNQPFTLTILFSMPTGINGGQSSNFAATINGDVTSTNGGVEVTFTNPSKTFTFTNGTQTGTFTLNLNNVAIGTGNQAPITGYINSTTTSVAPTPEPSSLMLLGTGLLSAAGVALRKRSLV